MFVSLRTSVFKVLGQVFLSFRKCFKLFKTIFLWLGQVFLSLRTSFFSFWASCRTSVLKFSDKFFLVFRASFRTSVFKF